MDTCSIVNHGQVDWLLDGAVASSQAVRQGVGRWTTSLDRVSRKTELHEWSRSQSQPLDRTEDDGDAVTRTLTIFLQCLDPFLAEAADARKLRRFTSDVVVGKATVGARAVARCATQS
jgi:hypothetical protein